MVVCGSEVISPDIPLRGSESGWTIKSIEVVIEGFLLTTRNSRRSGENNLRGTYIILSMGGTNETLQIFMGFLNRKGSSQRHSFLAADLRINRRAW